MQLPVTAKGARGAAPATLFLALVLTACDPGQDALRMHVPLHQQFDPRSVQSIFEERSGLRMTPAPDALGLPALEALSSAAADLTLLENSTPFVTGIRAVLPVYESVLHVMVREGFAPARADQPLRGAPRLSTASEGALQWSLWAAQLVARGSPLLSCPVLSVSLCALFLESDPSLVPPVGRFSPGVYENRPSGRAP